VILVSRAQNFEDVLLWRALQDVPQGSYLDIGAQDPVKDSVSHLFYEAGWRGVHVEPTPTYAARLRAARPDEKVIEAAVSTSPGLLQFHEFPDTGLSTGIEDIAATHSGKGYPSRKILVPTIRLDRLLEETGVVHWMKIDVEGMEADVLESWGDCPLRPWIVVVEATVPNTQIQTDGLWRDLLFHRGYHEAHFDGLSRYYVHDAHAKLTSVLEPSPNIFDLFQVTGEHFSAAVLVRDHGEELRQIREHQTHVEQEADSLRVQLEQTTKQTESEILARSTAENEAARLSLENGSLRDNLANLQSRCLGREEQLNDELAQALRDTVRLALEHSQSVDRLWREFHDREESRREASVQSERQLHEQIASSGEALSRALAERDMLELSSATSEALISSQNNEVRSLQARCEELGQLTEQLKRESYSIIAKAVAISEGRWHRLGRALGVVREREMPEAFEAWKTSATVPRETKGQAVLSSMSNNFLPRGSRNPLVRAESLQELLSWNDVDFVRCAYVTVLGRRPDGDGEAYYLARIRDGDSKLLVLRQLRKSPEARYHDPGIAGFDRELRRFWNARWPVIGSLLSPSYRDSWSLQRRRFRRLENLIFQVNDDQRRRLDELEGAITSLAANASSPRFVEKCASSDVGTQTVSGSPMVNERGAVLTRQITSQFSPQTIRNLRKKISA
jgi:FkbM family methyltransferase